MTNPVMVVRDQVRGDSDEKVGRGLWVWCPGCDGPHRPCVVGVSGDLPTGPCWDWDGDLEHPTISPSLLVHGPISCHSFIRAGNWEFLSDSEHALAGRTVPMVPLPDWLVRN